MGWRFRKSIKIAPGTRINLSRSGVSMTNRVGKTGVFHRTQLVGGRSNKKERVGCLPAILFVVVLCLILGALGFGKATETEDTQPTAAVVVTSGTPEPTPSSEPAQEEASTALEEYERVRAKLDALNDAAGQTP